MKTEYLDHREATMVILDHDETQEVVELVREFASNLMQRKSVVVKRPYRVLLTLKVGENPLSHGEGFDDVLVEVG